MKRKRNHDSPGETVHTEVAIIGAGLAGLYAARILTRAGIGSLVLEASERVGGRIYTVQSAQGVPIDMGGQWIGPGQKRITALARELGIRIFPTYDQGLTVGYHQGRRILYQGLIPTVDVQAEEEIRRAMSLLDAMAQQVPLEAPWQAKQAATWDQQTPASWLAATVSSPLAREWLKVFVFDHVFSAPIQSLSLLHVLFYIRSSGGVHSLIANAGGAQEGRLQGGAQQIALGMASELGQSVRLKTPVHTILHNLHGVQVLSEQIRVEARRAIVAIPPTLAGRLRYQPTLPGRRDHLTQSYPMGSVIKIHCIYEKPFWREEGLSGTAIGTPGVVSVTADNSPPNGTPGVLVCFVLAEQALLWRDRTPSERRQDVLDCLIRLFGKQAGQPLEYLEQVWNEQEYIRGAYVGYLPPGAWCTLGETLRTPLGCLHWASTETATEWNGYMDGALQSGERAATEVLAALQTKAATSPP